VKAILREKDSLTLWAYFYGLDSVIIQTLEGYLKPGMVVVDVGANVGLYTVVCASLVGKNGKVCAFEPVPWLAQRVKWNVRLNSMPNIEIYNIAVGAKSGKGNLYLSKSGQETSSLYQWCFTCNNNIEVSVITLDKWIQDLNINRIDLLKVDTEGSELDIFLGAQAALRDGIIKAIIVEFNKEAQKAAGFSCDDLRNLLAQYDFEWYRLPFDAHNRNQVDWRNIGDLSDLMAVKRDA
jgi:FkbM family methyltransferase